MTPKGNNNLNFRLASDQVVHFETAANLFASRVKQIIFYAVMSAKPVSVKRRLQTADRG